MLDPAFRFGAAFQPQLDIQKIVDPKLYVDFNDIGGLIDAIQAQDRESIAQQISAGVDVKLLNLVSARAGYSQGYYALGLGVDFWILKLMLLHLMLLRQRIYLTWA